MTSSRPWPFDDDDRPSGSVRPLSQADLQTILAHLSDDPDQLLAGTDADRPVVAVRVRATVGRPGGSAQASWQRMRAAEWAAWTRTLPWRVTTTLGIGAGGGIVSNLVAPKLSLMVGGLAAVVAGWGLRFQPSPDALAWRQGAAGERRTARLLDPLQRHGWALMHDLAVPGSRANIDHLVIGPGGVFVIDSKQYRGPLQLDKVGKLRHGHFPLVCRSCRLGVCLACFARSRRCWGPSGRPGWPTRPGSAATPPPNRQRPSGPQDVRQLPSSAHYWTFAA
jgi:hypothetical protein